MTIIRAIYEPQNGTPWQPNFPAADQHPDAVRYLVEPYYVDAIGGEPSLAEVEAVLNQATAITPIGNGIALEERQRQTAKDEAAALAGAGEYEAAFNKILELL